MGMFCSMAVPFEYEYVYKVNSSDTGMYGITVINIISSHETRHKGTKR